MKMVALLMVFLASTRAFAAAPDLAGIRFTQNMGGQVPMQTKLSDDAGTSRTLADFAAGHPVILSLGYFHCPSLCGLVRDDLLHGLAGSGLTAGRDYELLVLSIDAVETESDAARAKRADMEQYPLPGAAVGWHYLIGSARSVQSIATAVGFHDRFDDDLKQFLHPTGIVFLTPTGVISGYRLGLGYTPTDLRSGVQRAGLGDITRAALPVVLLCFHFDPTTGRYTLAVMRLLQLAGGLTVLTIGGTIALAVRRERRPP